MDSPPTVLVIGLGSVAVIILLGTCCACFAKKSEEENPQLDQHQQQHQINSAHNQQQRNPSIVQQQERLSMQQPIAIRLSFSTINELDNAATVNGTTIQSSEMSLFDPPPSYESVIQDLKQQIP
jgi:hypothetical protein